MANSKTPVNHLKLMKAVDRASKSLRNILNDQNIRLELIQSKGSQAQKYWKTKWHKNEGFPWDSYFNLMSKDPDQFVIALYSKNILYGLCLYYKLPNEILLHSVQGKYGDHPLKGSVIAAFSHAGINISQALKISNLKVLSPAEGTVPSFIRTGFKQSPYRAIRAMEQTVDSETTINWDAVQQYQKTKLATQYSSPATP
jgi:hypothetical protein